MFYSRAKQEVLDLLDIFDGMGSVDIAAYLTEHGYYGVSTFIDCPIAKFIKTQTGQSLVYVNQYRIKIITKFGSRKIYLPDNVSDFIEDFDYGKYPLLIDSTVPKPVYSPVVL